ncbi:Phosphoenolpyruvate-protein phosphotransferase of PTS system [Clostridiaceae bacterium JG1575]|nr:Phosphoenolpyruvate-protein phosphotransferase of PTS system [Clostridiaceae bacterium JG1575]
MKKYQGIPASKGYAMGYAVIKQEANYTIEEGAGKGPKEELKRLAAAVECAKEQLVGLREKTAREAGEEAALVFDAHRMFLEDPEFMGEVREAVEGGQNAMAAIQSVAQGYIAIFSTMEDEYLRERAADIQDVSDRVLQNLSGKTKTLEIREPQRVVLAHDLTPSDTAGLEKDLVSAFVTEVGGRTSHTAIMARTLEIPAVVGVTGVLQEVQDGQRMLVDGVSGEVILDPDEAALSAFERAAAAYQKEQKALQSLRSVRTVSRDGKAIEVSGNIGKPADVDAVLAAGGEGIGLYRTEFLYMDRKQLPDEQEQFEAYKTVLEAMDGRPVIIRTLDIGGDKKLPYLPLPEEMNPFLGYRAIRLCLDRPDLFKVQLRALLRAGAYGKLRVMFPMISGLQEFKDAMALAQECREELKQEGITVGEDIQWGIMVEIPAAAVCARELAEHVDFFSIGTNDLIQYTLAADRMSEKVSYLYDPLHPAVLRLIQMTIDGAHACGKWVGMCGEMAGDERAIPKLLAMGLDEFSMSASSILAARSLILDHDAHAASC